MSIKKCLQERQPIQVRLLKAQSWHYPNRESINSLLLEKQRQELEYEILRLRLQSATLNENEKFEQLRIRLSRLNSLTSMKTSTKTNSGLIHMAFRGHKQAFDNEFNHGFGHKSSQHRKRVEMDFFTRHFRTLRRAARNSLEETFNGVGEMTEQGYSETSSKPMNPKRPRSSSPASRTKIPSFSPMSPKVTKAAASTKETKPRTAEANSNPSRPNQKTAQASSLPPVNSWEEAGAPKIPVGLTRTEHEIYELLIRWTKTRFTRTDSTTPPNVVVITDLGKDYDDLAAMLILKELHRIGLINLQGFIANLYPAKKRAHFGRRCLDLLGLPDIPMCWGEEAVDKAEKRTAPKDYEFPKGQDYFDELWGKEMIYTPYNQDKASESQYEIQSGVKLLDRLIDERVRDDKKTKLTFLLISSLSDIATFAKREPELLAKHTDKVVFQGDYSIEMGPFSYHAILTPNLAAANNGFDKQAAKDFHQYIDNHHIRSAVYTRTAASAVKIPRRLFTDLAKTENLVGQHLCNIQGRQDTEYYNNACGDEEKRHTKDRDQNWFLDYRTNWYQKHPEDNREDPSTKPVGEAILPYVELVFYDALAALGTVGDDVLKSLLVLDPPIPWENQGPHIHKIVGVAEVKKADGEEAVPADPGVNVDRMKAVIVALMKGSLLACQQGIPSTHTS